MTMGAGHDVLNYLNVSTGEVAEAVAFEGR